MFTLLECILCEGPRHPRIAAEVELSGKRGDAWRAAASQFSSKEQKNAAFSELRALGVSVAEDLEDAFPTKKVKAQYPPGLASRKK